MNPIKGLESWETCTKCKIGSWAYKHVYGRGVLPCDLFFVGESAGRAEDAIGEAFVGPAGRLLEKALVDVPGKKFFGNLLMCRPCDAAGGPNRAPLHEEVSNCQPRLVETLRLSKPQGLILLGRVPALFWKSLFGTEVWNGPLLEAAHPAALLRRGGTSAEGWDAYKKVFETFAKETLRG